MSNVQIYICIDSNWMPVLEMPITELGRLTTRPLKWLRFVTSVIYGQKGFLYLDSNGVGVSDYDSTTLQASYFFWAEGPSRFIDLKARGRSAIPYFLPLAEPTDFRDAVLARDKDCVFSDWPGSTCAAVHIIPRSKGDEYFQLVLDQSLEDDVGLNRLNRDIAEMSISENGMHENIDDQILPVDGVDCIQNGVLLNASLHKTIGFSYVALIKTPNFALSPDDIPRLPDSNRSSSTDARLTVQMLKPGMRFEAIYTRHNEDARMPKNLDDWPSAAIVNASYCSAVLHNWGSPAFLEGLRNSESEHNWRLVSNGPSTPPCDDCVGMV
ncbi:hypothetical protein Hypma_009451 [Hypsizygus marmoreus]|uniref:HNH nuclease domain-containing protein n=1 Tax=Hypsizygus marmoreus TaxID=39966 RepID=A0A369JWA6_HYPMA|nr:hypothetical protein Hypma_009451 [Hypsizygus marmoreus]